MVPSMCIHHSFQLNSRYFILLQLFQFEECISFDAQQKVPVGLLQPAPAVFYDYYEPSRTICFCLFLFFLAG